MASLAGKLGPPYSEPYAATSTQALRAESKGTRRGPPLFVQALSLAMACTSA